MKILIKLIINSLAVYLSALILSHGIHLKDAITVVAVAVILGVVNTFLKPVLFILTLPVTLLTLGLFALILNALMVLLVSALVPGFVVDGLFWAFLFSLLMSVIRSFLYTFEADAK